MTHEELQDRLLDLAYGELAPRDARAVEEHARDCEACRAELARIQGTRRVMSALGDEPAPAGGERILLAAAREAAAARAPRRGVPRWLWGGGVAAASLAAVVAVSLRLGDVAPRPSVRDEPDALLGTPRYAEPPPAAGPEGGGAGDSAAKAEAAPAEERRFAERPPREAQAAKRAAGPRAPATPPARREREAAPADAWATAPEPPQGRAAPAPSAPPAPPAPAPAPSAGGGEVAPAAPAPSARAPEPPAAPQADVSGSAGFMAGVERERAAETSRAEAAPERRAAPAPAPSTRSRAMAPEAAAAAEAPEPAGDDWMTETVARYEELRRSGRLRADVREFPGCAQESWRRVERDPEGRIVAYSWQSGSLRLELVYAPDGRYVKRAFDASGRPDPFAKFRGVPADRIELDAPSACERPPGRP